MLYEKEMLGSLLAYCYVRVLECLPHSYDVQSGHPITLST